MKFYLLFVLSIGMASFFVACGTSATSTVAPTAAPAIASPTSIPSVTATRTPPETSVPASTIVVPTAPNSGLAVLEIRVIAQPTDVVNSSVVTIRNIEVGIPGAPGEWSMVVAEPEEFDLLELQGVEEVLGSSALEPGLYQGIRFDVTQVVLNIFGNVRNAGTPSEKLVLEGEFELVAGETTVLTLDFDPDNSIFFRPGIGPGFDPAIKLLVRSTSQSLAEAQTVATLGKEAVPSPTAVVPAPSTADTVRVSIPVNDNLQWMNFYVAQGAGFFEDEGIDIQIVVPPVPAAAGRWLSMGMADVAVLPRPLFLQAIEAGDPVVTFANLFSSDPINLIVQQQVADDLGLSLDMTLEDRLNAMRGLKVGVAHGPPNRLRALFKSVGLDADSDIEIVITLPEEQNPAFGDGTIDALYAHTPYLERALLTQGAVMIVNQSGGEVPVLTNRQIHTLVTTQNYADSNPEVLLAMARAVFRAQQLIHSDLEATAAAIRASEVTLQEPDGLETIIAIYQPAIPISPEVSVAGALLELELFYPSQLTPVEISAGEMEDHVDNQFAEAAVAGGS